MVIFYFTTSGCRKYDKDHSLKLEKTELKAFLAELNGGRSPKANSHSAKRETQLSAYSNSGLEKFHHP